MTVSCSAIVLSAYVSYVISMNAGNGSFSARSMTYSSNSLNYNIYTTSANTTVWGDGTNSTTTVSDSYSFNLNNLNGETLNYSAYGTIHANQSCPVGNYTDSITVTVTF